MAGKAGPAAEEAEDQSHEKGENARAHGVAL
jgi:hypothetical protein